MNKETFVAIVDVLDEYFNGDIAKAFNLLGISENKIAEEMDKILLAVENEIDPEHLAKEDELVADCGSYICNWLFSTEEFNEVCPNAGALYDYIENAYVEKQQKEWDARAEKISNAAQASFIE